MEGEITVVSDSFKMVIANIYSLPNGPVVTGVIETGTVRVGDSLSLAGANGHFPVQVIFIQRFQKSLDIAQAGPEPVGLTLSGIDRDQIKNRDVLIGKENRP